MRDERCSECGGEIITVADGAKAYFPSGRRCRNLFAHGAPRVTPRAFCDVPHPTFVGLACSEDRGHEIDPVLHSHHAILVVIERQEHEIVW